MNLFHLLAPRLCHCCGRLLVEGEEDFCLACLADAPVCITPPDILRMQRLPRAAPVGAVHTWLAYSNSAPLPSLIRRGKYGGRPDIISALGRVLAARVAPAIAGADLIVPVPMHWFKRLRRGFNQAQIIAMHLHRAAGVPLGSPLRAVRGHNTQSRRSATVRAANVAGMFALVDPDAVAGRHVVLVDDILTTGATLSEAIRALLPGGPRSITVVTLAAVE